MSLKRYGVLKGKVVAGRRDNRRDPTPHYQIHVVANLENFRVPVNVKSCKRPSELLFLVNTSFDHPVLDFLPRLAPGFTPLPVHQQWETLNLDYIRGNLFDPQQMRPLPPDLPGPDNDLYDLIDHYVARAEADKTSTFYAFGEHWGPERARDKIFHFRPGQGLHDIHMNQGNVTPEFMRDNGVWQDGGLFFHFPQLSQWVAIFLAFQSQVWHTNDLTGNALTPEIIRPRRRTALSFEGLHDRRAKIVSAMVNPKGPAPERETVMILNTSERTLDLGGWSIANTAKARHYLKGTLRPGASRLFVLSGDVTLSNKGGTITLLDRAGLKVDGVSYTESQAGREGRPIVF